MRWQERVVLAVWKRQRLRAWERAVDFCRQARSRRWVVAFPGHRSSVLGRDHRGVGSMFLHTHCMVSNQTLFDTLFHVFLLFYLAGFHSSQLTDCEGLHTLIFAISTLHFLVHALLHFALENAGSRRLVIVGDLEDMLRVDQVVRAAAHNMVSADIVLVHRHIAVGRAVDPLVVGRHVVVCIAAFEGMFPYM